MFSSPGQRFLRVARLVEPELEEPEEAPAQQEATSADTSNEPQAPASADEGVETDELYRAEDPRNRHADAEQDESPANQA